MEFLYINTKALLFETVRLVSPRYHPPVILTTFYLIYFRLGIEGFSRLGRTTTITCTLRFLLVTATVLSLTETKGLGVQD